MLAVHRGDSRFGRQLAESGAVTVQIDMDLRIYVSADETTQGNQQRAGQRDRVVQRAERKIGVIQNQHGPENAKHHVHPKPVPRRAERVHEAQSLAQRI